MHQNDPEKCCFVPGAPFERRWNPGPPAAFVRALKGQPKGPHRDMRSESERPCGGMKVFSALESVSRGRAVTLAPVVVPMPAAATLPRRKWSKLQDSAALRES